MGRGVGAGREQNRGPNKVTSFVPSQILGVFRTFPPPARGFLFFTLPS